jgi:carbon monoxide dehydrogenase subunit G
MDLGSTFVVPAPSSVVFAALLDPEVMRACITGCEELEQLSATSYRGRMRSEIAHVRFDAAFSANIADLEVPTRLHALLQGEDKRIASSIRIDASLQLSEAASATTLSYKLELALWGRIGRLGEAIVRRRSAEVQEQFEAAFISSCAARLDSESSGMADSELLALAGSVEQMGEALAPSATSPVPAEGFLAVATPEPVRSGPAPTGSGALPATATKPATSWWRRLVARLFRARRSS